MSRARRSDRLVLFVVGLLLFLAGAAVATLINGSVRRSKPGRCRRRWPSNRTHRSHPDSVSLRRRQAARSRTPAQAPLRRHLGGGRLSPPFPVPLHSAKPSGAGPLAHPVEQGTFNPKVQGSRPWRPTGAGYPADRYGVVTVEAMLWSDAPATLPTLAAPDPAATAGVDAVAAADADAVAAASADPIPGSDAVAAAGTDAPAGPDAPAAPAGPDAPAGSQAPAAPAAPDVAELAGPASRDVAADEAFLAEIAAELDSVEAALIRLDDGTFDRCQVCGGRIAQERLMADPLATRCSVHA